MNYKNPEDAARKGRFISIGIGVVILTVCTHAIPVEKQASSTSQASNATLLCEANVEGQILSRVLLLDYAKNTVNGDPAKFEEYEILWTTVEISPLSSRAVYHDHHLNRVAATYWADTRGEIGIPSGLSPRFKCRKAPARAF